MARTATAKRTQKQAEPQSTAPSAKPGLVETGSASDHFHQAADQSA